MRAAAVLAAFLLAGYFVGDDDVVPEPPAIVVRSGGAPLVEGFHLTGSATGVRPVSYTAGCTWSSVVLDDRGVVVASPGNATAGCTGEQRTLQANETVEFVAVWDGRGHDGARRVGNHTWELAFVDATGHVHGPARTPLTLR